MSPQRLRAAADPAAPGRGIIRLSWVATVVFAVTAIAGSVTLDAPFQQIAFATAFGLFCLGAVVFAFAFVAMANRSRTHELGIGGLFFAAGTAPAAISRHLNGSFALQCLVALGTSVARPYSTLAFGWLVPLVGLACTGWWCARHGTFGPRIVDDPRPGRTIEARGRAGGRRSSGSPGRSRHTGSGVQTPSGGSARQNAPHG
jgi:hypothetical protein